MKIATIRLPEDLYARVERQAERDHRSVNAQMVYILQRAVITPMQVIHHINGDPLDNRPENLEIRDAE